MATATPPTSPTTPVARKASPLWSGALGAALILVGAAIATAWLPSFWAQSVAPSLASFGGLLSACLRIVVQLALVGGTIALGSVLLTQNPPKGTRGAIGLILSFIIGIFFIVRAVGLNLEEWSLGLPVTVVILGALLGLSFRFLNSPSGHSWMVTLEEQGWFSWFQYKPNQGGRIRRYTLLALLLIGLSGVYSLNNQQALYGDWIVKIPFSSTQLTLLTDLGYSGLILLALGTVWISWRAVNMPDFADFLIATEAEMNKVSWSKRKRLIQDTIVVLVFVILITVFLMLVDLFWGWLLSAKYIEVLPGQSNPNQPTLTQDGSRELKW